MRPPQKRLQVLRTGQALEKLEKEGGYAVLLPLSWAKEVLPTRSMCRPLCNCRLLLLLVL